MVYFNWQPYKGKRTQGRTLRKLYSKIRLHYKINMKKCSSNIVNTQM